jgi:hypothetical protein
MAKDRHVTKSAAAAAAGGKPRIPLPSIPPGTMPPNYDPTGPGEQMDVVTSKDGWSEYTLDDGSILRLKATLVDAKRAVGQYSSDGNPLYLLQYTVINQLISPEKLRKKD